MKWRPSPDSGTQRRRAASTTSPWRALVGPASRPPLSVVVVVVVVVVVCLLPWGLCSFLCSTEWKDHKKCVIYLF